MLNRLYNAWKRERLQSRDLQSLEPNFYREISQYIRKIFEQLRNVDEKAPKYQLLNMELGKIQKLTSSIIETRFQKFIDATLERKNISKALLSDEEVGLYEKILEVSEQYQNLKDKILEGQNFEPKLEACLGAEKILVRFMVKIPIVVGVDMKNYGPFDLEDIATLPRENAEALIRQKAAAKIDVEN